MDTEENVNKPTEGNENDLEPQILSGAAEDGAEGGQEPDETTGADEGEDDEFEARIQERLAQERARWEAENGIGDDEIEQILASLPSLNGERPQVEESKPSEWDANNETLDEYTERVRREAEEAAEKKLQAKLELAEQEKKDAQRLYKEGVAVIKSAMETRRGSKLSQEEENILLKTFSSMDLRSQASVLASKENIKGFMQVVRGLYLAEREESGATGVSPLRPTAVPADKKAKALPAHLKGGFELAREVNPELTEAEFVKLSKLEDIPL